MLEPVDLFAIVLVLAVLIGCINHLWIKLPPAIGMLLGSLVVSLLIVSSDHVFHLHVMRWFRGTLDEAHLPRVFLNAALALTLPRSPWRADLLVVTYAVVVFTIVVQGLTIPGVLQAMYGVKGRITERERP